MRALGSFETAEEAAVVLIEAKREGVLCLEFGPLMSSLPNYMLTRLLVSQ